MKLPPVMAMAPSPYPLRRNTATSGTVMLAPLTKRLDMRRTAACFSLSGPTINPGVSVRDTTGSSKASHSWRKRAAFSALSASTAPPNC